MVCLCFIFQNCSNQDNSTRIDKVYFNKLVKLDESYRNEDLIVYYFDGDCALCLAKVKYLEEKKSILKNTKVLFLTKTINPEAMRFSLSKIVPGVIVHLDNANQFAGILSFNKITKINNDRVIERGFEEREFKDL